ncbi:hypothetical protein K6U58_09735 [Vibrio fluvialis]|uniref:hypothetical protein n=1 Tax=Vibrio fluvialis TaxID=676 RepID=UPI001EEAC35D|nr:hypothetical protein [Vibrio fluvialis]MCG6358872.1 hypothetical protein [Vibrio fluvialis]
MNIPQLYYSIDELALYLAGLNPFEVSSINQAEFENWTNSATAKQWQVTIIQHIASKSLLLKDDVYIENEQYFHDLDGGVINDSFSPFSMLLQQLDSANPPVDKRIIPVTSVVEWSKKYSIELWFNLNSASEGNISASTENSENNQPDNIGWVKDIASLLSGSHDKHAPELALAVQTWLKAIQDPTINPNNVRSGIERLLPNGTSDAAIKRICTVANWNKDGNR